MITYLRHSRSEQLKIIFYVKYSSLFVYKHWRTFGPWWWSSGQRACLLLRKSKFKFRWSLQFYSLNYLKNLKNKALLIFKKKHWRYVWTLWPASWIHWSWNLFKSSQPSPNHKWFKKPLPPAPRPPLTKLNKIIFIFTFFNFYYSNYGHQTTFLLLSSISI